MTTLLEALQAIPADFSGIFVELQEWAISKKSFSHQHGEVTHRTYLLKSHKDFSDMFFSEDISSIATSLQQQTGIFH